MSKLNFILNSMNGNERKIREEMIFLCKEMHKRFFIASSDGNLSFRLSGNEIITTPSGLNKGFITPDDLIIVDRKGAVIRGERKPTSEIKLHLEAYNSRDDISAVIHAHPPTVIAFSIAGIEIPSTVLPEVILTLGTIPTAEYATPTTEDVPKSIHEYIKKYDALILCRHGSLTVGTTLTEAYNKLERMEHAAIIAMTAQNLGNVRPLPESEVCKLMNMAARLGVRSCSSSNCCGGKSCGRETDNDKNHSSGNIDEEIIRDVLKNLKTGK